jgi:hypothetical protein
MRTAVRAGAAGTRAAGLVRAGALGAVLAVGLAGGWAAGAVLQPAFPGSAGPPGARPPGLTLVPRTTQLDPGRPGEYVFTLTGPGAPATPPRLTVVRRDATALQHPTPVAAPGGSWRAPLTLPAAGDYRVVVEVGTTGGPPRALTADLRAPGPFAQVPFTTSRAAEVDGYQVRLDGDLVPGTATQVFATVSRGGAPVTDLEPVDGGFGRLEALRAGDLAAVPVHPDAASAAGTDRAGPGIAFTAEAPGPGTYRVFLDFRHAGVQHTAVFTVATGSTG